MSDLQRDIERLDFYMSGVGSLPLSAFEARAYEAWQRIRARLTPDRERVADAIWNATGCVLCDVSTYKAADAAIAAMGETP